MKWEHSITRENPNIEEAIAYEKKLIDVVDKKLFNMHPNTGTKKKKLYSQIESFKVIP